MSASIRRQVYVQFVLILMCKLFSTFAKMKLLVKTILPTGKTHSGTVIFFHGSGNSIKMMNDERILFISFRRRNKFVNMKRKTFKNDKFFVLR